MLQPKRQKFRKVHRGRNSLSGKSKGGNTVAFGSVGLKAMTAGEITSRQIEAARRVIARGTKRAGKVWIRLFPDKPITKKASEVPMGSGKGSVEFYVCPVKPGKILFEMDGVTEAMAKEVLELAGDKLPLKTKVVRRHI